MDASWKEGRMHWQEQAAGATDRAASKAADRRMWTRQANRQESIFTYCVIIIIIIIDYDRPAYIISETLRFFLYMNKSRFRKKKCISYKIKWWSTGDELVMMMDGSTNKQTAAAGEERSLSWCMNLHARMQQQYT